MKCKADFLKLLPILIAGAVAGQAHAAGFAISEMSASGGGSAYAGGAAASEDASVVWFNPAAMSKLQGSNFTGVLHVIHSTGEFNNTGSTPPAVIASSGNGGDYGGTFLIPNLYLTLPVTQDLSFGLGINAPFGLTTEYDSTWIGRVQAIKSEIKSLNVGPTVSWKINDMVSVGAGIDYQNLEATLTNVVAGVGSDVKINASDNAYGYNLGLLLTPATGTQIGLHYRSAIKYDLRGRADFAAPLTAFSADVSVSLKVPESYSLSMIQKLDTQWTVMADATRTNWSSVPELRIVNANTGATIGSAIALNWKDTWRFSLGANYALNDKTTLRMGIAYDQAPAPDTAHTIARLPDGDRTWLSFGGQYKIQPKLKLDVSYCYIHFKTAHMDSTSLTNSAGNGRLVGDFNSTINVLSAQLNYQF
ncbi:MAG: transporter [Burkholderiaceae bacterium]|nr:MAG: transporter [Burkholderiaceae bacterium]